MQAGLQHHLPLHRLQVEVTELGEGLQVLLSAVLS